jgi:hypothetical protein
MTREHIEVRIAKVGRELQIQDASSDQEGITLPNFEHRMRVELGEIRIELGVNGTPDIGPLTEKLRYITSGYLPVGLADQWPIILQQTMWRPEGNGAKSAIPEERANLGVSMGIPPLTAGPIPLHIEITRFEESVNLIQVQGDENGFDCMVRQYDRSIEVHFEKQGTIALRLSATQYARLFGCVY